MATALVVASGVAIAVTKTCPFAGFTTPSNPSCIGTNDADVLTGGTSSSGANGADYIQARGGNDKITGDRFSNTGRDDKLDGGSGNDTYFFKGSKLGNDTIVDSSGTDTVNFSTVPAPVAIILAGITGGEATVFSPFTGFQIFLIDWSNEEIENAVGGQNDDRFHDNTFNNKLSGGGGNDTFHGADGFDTYSGDGGNDNIFDGSVISDDLYKFARGFGVDTIDDNSDATDDTFGRNDVADLRAYKSSEFIAYKFDYNNNVNSDTLVMEFVDGSLLAIRDYYDDTPSAGPGTGRIETFKFSNTTITTITAASASATVEGEASAGDLAAEEPSATKQAEIEALLPDLKVLDELKQQGERHLKEQGKRPEDSSSR